MCKKWWHNLWNKPDPIPVPIPEPELGASKKIALLFGDNYPGTDYELSGCVNDINDVETKLNKEFPGYVIHKFKNEEVIGDRFYQEIRAALDSSHAGDFILIWYSGHGTQLQSHEEPDGYNEAFYFSDGVFSDKQLMELQQWTPEGVVVSANFDSCFSGGMDKAFGNPYKNKFHQMPGVPRLTRRLNSMSEAAAKWVINAFCKEGQTCADATFNNRANGAGTYFYLKCFTPGTTFNQAMTNLIKYLPGNGFDQYPGILGDSSLFDNKY